MERSHLRAADADRKRVVAELERHFVDGRLSSDEYGERVSQALAARTFGELEELQRDLPVAGAPSTDLAEQAAEPADEPSESRAFRTHAMYYALVMVFLVLIWLMTSRGYFWPIWPMLGWGFGLAAHGLARANRSGGRSGGGHGRGHW